MIQAIYKISICMGLYLFKCGTFLKFNQFHNFIFKFKTAKSVINVLTTPAPVKGNSHFDFILDSPCLFIWSMITTTFELQPPNPSHRPYLLRACQESCSLLNLLFPKLPCLQELLNQYAPTYHGK